MKPVLLAFGDNASFVGKEIGHASALDVAVLSWAISAMLGFLQGYIVCEAENLPGDRYMQLVKSLTPALEMILSGLIATIQAKDYDKTQAALDAYAPCPRELIKWCGNHGVDHSFVDPQFLLMEKAVKAGRGQSDFAYLYEVLKKRSA